MRKFLLIIAFLISVVGLNAQSVGSSSIVYYDGYSLKFTVTKLDPAECKVVCDTEPTTPVAVSIPSSVTIEGSTFSVTSIGNDVFYNCNGLTSIEIPNSVTSIGEFAFYNCDGLTSIEIPNSVTSIGNDAFNHCSGLTSIEIPNSVTSIGNRAFSACDGLESFVVEGGNPNYDSRNNCNAIIETQTNTLLYGCMNTIIPNSVTSIGNDAFSNCDGLTSIEIPNSVTSIGDGAFSYCDGLTSIEIPNSVTSIGDVAFVWCSKLERIKCHAVEVPVTATTAFFDCPKNMNIQVPEESVALYQAAEPWKNYNVTEIPLYQIGDYVVVDYEGYSLRYTIIKLEPAECEVICETKPTTEISITIPSSVEIEGVVCNVTKIGNSAFSNCSGLTSIEIPNSVTSIGERAFYSCSGLTSIEIPNSVTSIGNYAFFSCSGLTSIEIPNSVTSIGNPAFIACDGLESFVVEGGNPNYDSRDNCNAIIETQTNTLLYGCMNTIIPNSVTSIGNFAFYSCSGLTSIEIPNSVTSIGERAFCFCYGLTSIEIPNSVTSIGNEAFDGCDGLESFVVEGGNPNYDSRNNCNAIIETQTNTLLYGCMNTIIPNSVTSIGNSAFCFCSGLTSIEIPNSVTTIGDIAFSNCYGLTSIEIPNSVTSIGRSAFYNCSGLTSIEIPNSVTSIGNFAFSSCSHLRSIKCHAVDVPVTATDAFNDCPEDMNIQVPEGSVALYQAAQPWSNYNVTKMDPYQIGDYVVVDYEGYSLRYTIIKLEPAECEVICETKPTTKVSITIPSSVEIEGVECSVTKIGNSAFYYCDYLASIEIPNSVTSIGNEAFYSCDGLTSIEIPNSVTSIGNFAFSSCNGLTSIEIPNSVTSIGDWAFSNCYGLTSIEIPNSVTSIGNEAFYSCSSLTSIEIPNSVTSIGNYAFGGCDGLESFVVEGGNPNYDSRNNCNAIIETQTNTLLYGCMNTIIPNSVTSIGDSAFSLCNGLTSIEIPNSVTSIGRGAFFSCSGLTSIEIPNSVTSIGSNAFIACDGLESFVVEGGNPNYDSRNNCNAIIETQTNTLLYGCMNTIIPNSVTSIGNEAFNYCFSLTSIEIPNSVTSIGDGAFSSCNGLTSIEIPNSVTSIGNSAFSYCDGLTSIEIPNSVTSIGNSAFSSCDGLTSIEIPNSVTSIGDGAFSWSLHLRSIKCHAVDVPVTATNAFYYCPEDMTIQVPEESVALYQAAEPWKNYNIVAGFNSTINLTSNIEEGGFVEGGGNYQDGTEITVYAYVNPNYGFLYWSEDEEIVSYSPEYTFTVSNDRNLTANFAINHWIPDYTIYPNTMAVVGVVQIDGIEQNSSNIEIGAFCGNELRGSNRLFYESKYDRYYLYLTIYGKDDDEISFKIYDHTIESELKLYYIETINFSVDDNIGNVGDPMIFNFTTEFLHKRQLSSNWNWYSTFVAVEGRNGFVMLTEGLGELGIQVKSQFAFSNYSAGDWSGGLNTVSTENMYMIKMSEPTELGMSGIIVEPSEFPIVLSRNWKWIPYPVSVPMDVTTAFAGFTPHDGDIVKSQEGFTQYYEGIGWSGSLNTMIPGEGYMYHNTSGEEKTLYYPSTNEAKGVIKTNITSENNYWKPEVSKYPTNMSVIAVVDHSDELDFEVAAFSNGECRGSARPIYIDGIDKNILFLTIYGEDNETITFRYYDANSGEEYNISNRIIYSTDSTIGNVKEPYVINLIPANVNEITENEVCIYPNPVNTNSEIHLTTECDKVEIYNTLGVKIAEYENINSIEGIETSGVYLIKIINEGAIKYDRIIVR